MITLKEAILKGLEDLSSVTNYLEVYKIIVANKYYDFGTAKTPTQTVSSALGEFIRKGDTRVKRIPGKGGNFFYYLTKQESLLSIDDFTQSVVSTPELIEQKQPEKLQDYNERSLHMLLSTYLKSQDIYAKTILHEVSNGKDANQIWTHPDMVGIKLLKLQHKTSQSFIRTVNRADTFKTYSYEIKKELTTDNELKRAYFQAVSNSSWANYGYLVAFSISSNLMDEIERLNQSFGIGLIEIDANPYQSKVHYQPRYRDLDFKTIDKLCLMNKDFSSFIEQVDILLDATDKHRKAQEAALHSSCDKYLATDAEVVDYCAQKNIPSKYTE